VAHEALAKLRAAHSRLCTSRNIRGREHGAVRPQARRAARRTSDEYGTERARARGPVAQRPQARRKSACEYAEHRGLLGDERPAWRREEHGETLLRVVLVSRLIAVYVGSAISIERVDVFSGGRDTISLRRASFKPETICALMLVEHSHFLARDRRARARRLK
jgi:hypothetical protein